MNADERRSSGERRATDHSGHDIDIWGDGSPTNSTPIPEESDSHEGTESTKKSWES